MSLTVKPTLRVLERLRNPEGRLGKLRLDKNENVLGLSDELFQEIVAGITPEMISAYPEVEAFYQELAQSLGVSPENLMLSSGSDPAIKAFFEVFVSPGDEVVLLQPTYAMYGVYAQMFEAAQRQVPFGPDLSLDLDRLIGSVAEKTRLVAIANPNAPTGTILEEPVLLEIIAKAGRFGAAVLIDEAYHPFYSKTMLSHIREHDNLAVIRTMSKAFGLAGLRLGYAVAQPALIELLMKVRPMYEVNALAAHFGRHLLAHPEVIEDYVAQVEAGKARLLKDLAVLGLESHPTWANFILIKMEKAELRREARLRFAEAGILVAGELAPPLEGCLRLTLGPPPQMRLVAALLSEVMGRFG